MYPWGGPNVVDEKACFLANFKTDRGDYAADGAMFTAGARSYAPNGYNLYNMAGNVAEWTADAYVQGAYITNANFSAKPVGAEATPLRVVRGGSWRDPSHFFQVATRATDETDSARSSIGFRTAFKAAGPAVDESNIPTSGRSGK